MYKNYLRYTLLAGMMSISFSAGSQPPYVVDKVISPNKIVELTNQKLLIIDFWATWCAPCPAATQQLEILQETNPNDVFAVALSDESEETILSFLQKKPIRLSVLQDYLPNSLVNFFDVKSRPYAVLLSLDGKILFKGHPSDITASMIKNYAAQMKSQPSKKFSDLFIEVQKKAVPPPSEADKELKMRIVFQPETKMYITNGIFYYTGPLSGLLKYLSDCSSSQIAFDEMVDLGISMSCGMSQIIKSKQAVLQLVKKRLSLNIKTEHKHLDAYILHTVNPQNLWDVNQIDWGDDANPLYIIGTDRIEADNMTIKEIAALLTDVKGKYYYCRGNDKKIHHDWSFHYRYDDLMKEDLEANYGIQMVPGKPNLPFYVISIKRD